MPLKGRLRRLLSSSTGTSQAERSRRMSDVSENSDISYDRSSGSFVQRVTTSLRSRSAKYRRAASESAALEESYDGSFAYPDESSTRPSPLRPPIPLSESPNEKKEAVDSPQPLSSDVLGDATDLEPLGKATTNVAAVIEEDAEEEEEQGEEKDDGDYPVPSAWGDEPSPEQLQQIQDRVSAWLDKSRAAPSSSPGLRFPSNIESNPTLLEIPEEPEDAEEDFDATDSEPLAIRPQPLRMLDSISEDEVPGFVGSSVSTAPSTPLPPLPQIARSRSQSPPLRRRSLEGQEEYYPRGLDTIQEAGDVLPPPSPRRSLDSVKRPTTLALESIPEIDLPPSSLPSSLSGSSKRRFGVKGFGFTRSESEPLMPTFRTFNTTSSSSFSPSFTTSMMSTSTLKGKRKAPPTLNVLIGGKPPGASFRAVKESALASPSLPSFQRGASAVMGQRPAALSGPASEPRKPMNLRAHSLGSIAVLTEKIEDEESRRLTEAAFLG